METLSDITQSIGSEIASMEGRIRKRSAAAKAAFDLVETSADEATVAATANQLASEYDDGIPLSDAQMSVLCDYIKQRIDKHQKLDRIEAALIDDPDKNNHAKIAVIPAVH